MQCPPRQTAGRIMLRGLQCRRFPRHGSDFLVLHRPLVFLDLETTGATAHFDRITEIGLVEVDQGECIGEWSTLVNPEQRIPPNIEMLTGISNAMVEDAPKFAELAGDLMQRLEGRVLVAHNARFDYGFLRNEFKRLGLLYQPEVLCTVKLSRRLFPSERSHSLDSLIARHQLSCANRHRALADARVLWDFTRQIHLDLDHSLIQSAVDDLLKGPTIPAGLPRNVLDGLPEGPGVYLFFGENDAPLYVGKSINIRARVMSHFSSDHSVAKDMRLAQEVRRLESIETSGELGALLKEALLVKKLSPVHNRKLRRSGDLTSLHWNPVDGPKIPATVSAADLTSLELAHVYGVFRSKRKAMDTLRDLADEHGLCHRLLGLENGKGPCFAFQLKKCRGACVGKESELNHAMRLSMALSRLRVEPWPFQGRIGLREVHRASGLTEIHLLDRWCYLGTVRDPSALHDALETRHDLIFDLDTYQILTRFFKRHSHNLDIIALSDSR
jgi:DNA polymerase-3 subunit epsilon